MRALAVWTGAIVLLLMLASAGVLHGDVCLGRVGCLDAHGQTIQLHPAP